MQTAWAPREAKRRERNGYEKMHSAMQIERERERKKKRKKEKERKNKEIGNCLPHTRYALSTPPGVYII
jgi:hypothetical protein